MVSRRPFKVRFHHDGTRRADPATGLPWIDHTTPINGMDSFTSVEGALAFGRTVSNAGGRAEVFHRHPGITVDTPIRTCEPYEDTLLTMAEEASSR